MSSSASPFLCGLLMLLCLTRWGCSQSTSTLGTTCSAYLLDQQDIICGNVTYNNAATIIGVQRVSVGTYVSYTVELLFSLNFGELSPCFVPLQWTKVPKTDATPLCGSLVECRNTQECLSILPQSFNFTLDGVTFSRPLSQKVADFPYEYMLFSRRFHPQSYFATNSKRAFSINDDDADNVNLGGCRKDVCAGTVNNTCRYLGYDQKPGVAARTPCSSSSTGDFEIGGYDFDNDACLPAYRKNAYGANEQKTSLSCCQSCNYNNNGATYGNPGVNVYDQSYRQGQAGQWRVFIQHPDINPQLPFNFFSPAIPGEQDNSYSCCADVNCPDTRSLNHCNRSPRRYPFPQDPPLNIMNYPGLNTVLLPVNMSNRLQTASAGAMDRNVTNLRPRVTIASVNNYNLNISAAYMAELYNVNFTGASGVAFGRGMWMPVLGAGPNSGSKTLITKVTCAYCGIEDPWNSPDSRVCNATNSAGGNTTTEYTAGGTYAMMNWVLGMSPICHQWTISQGSSQPTIAVPIHLRFGGTLLDLNANMKLGSVKNTSGIVLETVCFNCNNIQDAFIPSGSGQWSAENNLVYCEPYEGFAATVLGTRFTNPWLGLKNPVTGADNCASCAPDDFHIRQSDFGKYRILWYFVTKDTASDFISSAAAALNNAGNWERNGYTDAVLLEDDCDDTSVDVFTDYGNQKSKSPKGYYVVPRSNIYMRCAVPGMTDIPVGMQSLACRSQTESFGRPRITSRTIGMTMYDVRSNLAGNNTASIDKAWAAMAAVALAKKWDRDRPNMWLGWNSNTSTGQLLYQYNRADARAINVKNSLSMRMTVPSSMIVPIERISPLDLTQTQLCLCVDANTKVSGTVTFRVPNGGNYPTQATYLGAMTLDGGAVCYVNPSSGSSGPVTNQQFVVQPNKNVVVNVQCTSGSRSPTSNALLKLTLVNAAQPQFIGDSQQFYVPCCASQNLALPPATGGNLSACPVGFSSAPVVGTSTANFLYNKCGASAFTPSPVPTPPPAEEPLPVTTSSTSASFSASGSATATATRTRTPSPSPTRTPYPTFTPSASVTPVPVSEANGTDTTLDVGVIVGVSVAVGVVAIAVVVGIGILIYYCTKSPKEKNE